MKKNQAVKVAIRVRPLNKRENQMKSPICIQTKQNILGIKQGNDSKQFIFDYVFGIESRQESIYENCAFSLMQNGLDGYNGTIFAYGQTGAGKTFTMVGDYKDNEYKGIIPRGFDHLIGAIHSSEDKKYVMRASFIEIYNEQIMDLLEEKTKNKSEKKDLKESPDKGVYIKDLKMVAVKSVDQLFKILDFGNKNRTVFATAMNATSSRSHALFTVHIQSLEGQQKVKASKINLVDLAGSQRASKTQATGDRLKEGAKINLSLTALGNVINSLVDGKGGHIPYRDSKLTRMLQDSLGGNTKTLMIASISPAADNYDETLSTLRYAARARNIKNTPKINEDPKDAMIRQYLAEIEKLRKIVQTGGSINMSSQLSAEQIESLRQAHQKATEKQKELMQKEEELRLIKKKLEQMEGLVLKKQEGGEEVIKAKRLKKKKIMKQQQLLMQKIANLQEQDHRLIQSNMDSNVKYQSVEKEAEYWKQTAKQLQKRLRQAIQDKKDLNQQFQAQRVDLNFTIRTIEGNLSLYRQIALKFITESDIATIKQNSEYDNQKRSYTLAPFLLHEDQITLPKTLNRYEAEDLWNEKRKNYKLKFIHDDLVDLPEVKGTESKIVSSPTKKEKTTNIGSPFIQNRKLFKMSDYNSPMYKQKQYNVSQADNIFRRTNFRIAQDSRSRSKSRSENRKSVGKMEPIQRLQKVQITNDQEGNEKRPTSRSRGKEILAPIVKK